jgi:hypothetical protein
MSKLPLKSNARPALSTTSSRACRVEGIDRTIYFLFATVLEAAEIRLLPGHTLQVTLSEPFLFLI